MRKSSLSPASSTSPSASTANPWTTWLDRRIWILLFLGFSAGLPILLIFSSLSLWLGEAGVERKAVTYFSWAALGYSFKFVWAPLVDRLPLPGLTPWLGKRRSYLLLAQVGVMLAIVGMAMTDPSQGHTALTQMALFAVLLGFSSATQDIAIDAYRIEVASTELQGMLSSSYIAGYRIAMVLAGAGALLLAQHLGSSKGSYLYAAWKSAYLLMAACMAVGVLTTLLMREPTRVPGPSPSEHWSANARLMLVFVAAVLAFVGVFANADPLLDWGKVGPILGLLQEMIRLGLALCAATLVAWILVGLGLARRDTIQTTWMGPAQDFFNRYGRRTAWLLLALIGTYRISDIVLGVISNVFYQDMGYTKEDIAFAVKTFGVVLSIAGSFLGGMLVMRLGVMRSLFWGAVLSSLTNLGFVLLAYHGPDVMLMYSVVAADNLAGGFASAAFVAMLSGLVNVSFTATQYAIFSSLMTLLPKTLGGYSGTLVDALGYPGFFIFTTVIGLPVLLLVWLASHIKTPPSPYT
jgi:MFS transporter, PAT family, beta-lactamase induction signal transducer AmpG